jgi:hypothetical protein
MRFLCQRRQKYSVGGKKTGGKIVQKKNHQLKKYLEGRVETQAIRSLSTQKRTFAIARGSGSNPARA